MFDDIFSLYYELFAVNSCRSYCLNKFDISDRMNYFQPVLKYFFGMYNMASKFGIIHDRSYWNLLDTIVTFKSEIY